MAARSAAITTAQRRADGVSPMLSLTFQASAFRGSRLEEIWGSPSSHSDWCLLEASCPGLSYRSRSQAPHQRILRLRLSESCLAASRRSSSGAWQTHRLPHPWQGPHYTAAMLHPPPCMLSRSAVARSLRVGKTALVRDHYSNSWSRRPLAPLYLFSRGRDVGWAGALRAGANRATVAACLSG